MTHELSNPSFHPAGQQPPVGGKGPPQGVILDSFSGPVLVEWDTEAALTPLGQLPFFIDFLKAAGLFDAFVADCPLRYTSPNAPKKRDVFGNGDAVDVVWAQALCSLAALRCDSVLPELLGMNKIVSEDAVRHLWRRSTKMTGRSGFDGISIVQQGAACRAGWILRHRYDCEATLRPSGRRGDWLQPQEARAAEPFLSYLLDGWRTAGPGCGCLSPATSSSRQLGL